jgi:hypothetical protein
MRASQLGIQTPIDVAKRKMLETVDLDVVYVGVPSPVVQAWPAPG